MAITCMALLAISAIICYDLGDNLHGLDTVLARDLGDYSL